jgi:hypothetical protein
MKRTLTISISALSLLMAAACSSADPNDEPSPPATEEDRGPIGKADLVGSCLEIDIMYCGGKSSGNCWCDDLCTDFGDCCDDYESACLGTEPSCDPTLICGQAVTCVDGSWYPTTCGPANCDEPMGPCEPPAGEPCGDQICGEGEECQYCWGQSQCVPEGAQC